MNITILTRFECFAKNIGEIAKVRFGCEYSISSMMVDDVFLSICKVSLQNKKVDKENYREEMYKIINQYDGLLIKVS